MQRQTYDQGQMVSGLALYSDNESLNPAEINVSYSV